jgi:hypothetical protein
MRWHLRARPAYASAGICRFGHATRRPDGVKQRFPLHCHHSLACWSSLDMLCLPYSLWSARIGLYLEVRLLFGRRRFR